MTCLGSRIGVCVAVLAVVVLFKPKPVDAQFSHPCDWVCGATLALDSYVVASATAAAAGRSMGGFSRVSQGLISWGSGFVMTAATGVALQGNGDRQRRAIYGGALGGAAGGLFGLALESAIGESTNATRLSSSLIGAGLGVLAGGVLGAITLDGIAEPGTAPLFVIRVSR